MLHGERPNIVKIVMSDESIRTEDVERYVTGKTLEEVIEAVTAALSDGTEPAKPKRRKYKCREKAEKKTKAEEFIPEAIGSPSPGIIKRGRKPKSLWPEGEVNSKEKAVAA